MKKYIAPALQVTETEVCQMLAESLNINSGTTVDGGSALTKDADWDLWSSDEDED